MDFAIRTISFAISMRISSPQLQRRQGPGPGGWWNLVRGKVGEREESSPPPGRERRVGAPPALLLFPMWPQICRDIDSRQENRLAGSS